MPEVTLRVEGMTCAHCASTVQQTLSRVPGITDPHVDLEANMATLTGTDEAAVAAACAAVADKGYEVRRVAG